MKKIKEGISCFFLVFLCFLFSGTNHLSAQNNVSHDSVISEPYRPISGRHTGITVKESPDPLVGYQWDKTTAKDELEIYTLRPKSIISDKQHRIDYGENSLLPLNVKGSCNLMIDFGIVSAGWLEFDSDEFEGEVEMSISEYNEPAVFNVGSVNPKKTLNPKKYGSTYRLELNPELYEGVRFGWIHFKNVNKPFTISDIRLTCQVKPTNYLGSFSSNNELLNRIWYTGAYTVKVNFQKDYFGAILMERSDRYSWTGDAYPSQAASLTAFGNYDFVRKNLIATSTLSNQIPSYSVYWILSLVDYCNASGDKLTLKKLLANAVNILDTAATQYENPNNLVFNGWDERLGSGFENPNNEESKNVFRTLTIQAWVEFSKLMDWYGRKDLSSKYMNYASQKLKELRSQENWINQFGIHSISNLVNADVLDLREKEVVWNTQFENRLQRISYSPFNQFFIIQALAKLGKYEHAYQTIDDCWGGQIRYGATTFFEVYRPSWNEQIGKNGAPINNQCGYTSLAHPWGAGVTTWISEELLGIKSTIPGFETFEVSPKLPSDLSWMKGAVPTKNGQIKFSYDKLKNMMKLDVPKNTMATVRVPNHNQPISNVFINDESIIPTKKDGNYYLKNLTEGNYTIRFNFEEKLEFSSNKLINEPLKYSYKRAIEDSNTHGNWKKTYGNKGYILFNYDSIDGHRKKLPSFVDKVDFRLNKNLHYSEPTENQLILQADNDNNWRKMGALMTGDPVPTFQTMTIDVYCNQKNPYQFSLYMLDWDKGGRRAGIELFDLDTKELLMPIKVVEDYEDGKYIIIEADRSIRVRINHIRGSNVLVSGIFFD